MGETDKSVSATAPKSGIVEVKLYLSGLFVRAVYGKLKVVAALQIPPIDPSVRFGF